MTEILMLFFGGGVYIPCIVEEFTYLVFTRQVGATAGDSDLCCCVPSYTCDVRRATLTPFVCVLV